jgi:hypothetical protein
LKQGLSEQTGTDSGPENRAVEIEASEKYAIADNIVTESRSKTDVVQDVFDELAEHFEIRRRSNG